MKLTPTGDFPCQEDDLLDEKRITIATICTLKDSEVKKQGIRKGTRGVYDIYVCADEINGEIARVWLEKLSKKTGVKYELDVPQTRDDEIIKYADKLIDLGKKYRKKDGWYDFSTVKTPAQKARVIKSWIGEILYEATTYKEKRTTKSLVDVIETEIEELIKQ